MRFNQEEGNIILDALHDYDQYILPRSMSRKVLFGLMRKFMDKLNIEIADGGFSLPDLYFEKFDSSKSIDIDLDIDELDYINQAVTSGNYAEPHQGLPAQIQKAAENVCRRTEDALKGVEDLTPENSELYEDVFGKSD